MSGNTPQGRRIFVGLDIETTGTNKWKHSILEIGAIAFSEEDISDLPWDEFNEQDLREFASLGDSFHGCAKPPEGVELDAWIVKTHGGAGGLLAWIEDPSNAEEVRPNDVELCKAFAAWFDMLRAQHAAETTFVFFGRNVGSFDRAFIEQKLEESLPAYHRALDLSAFFEVSDLLTGREARKESKIEKVEIEGLREHRSIDDVLRDLVILSRLYAGCDISFDAEE